MPPGRSPGSASPTPATPSCPRPSRCGRSSCWAGCCPVIWRSSTGSTTSSSRRCANASATTRCGSATCRSSPSIRYRSVRMAYLATVAGAKVNGVAELHSQLLRDKVLNDFDDFFPGKFTNVTNGVTPRRFLRLANPELSSLITDAIGDGWVDRSGAPPRTRALRRGRRVPRARSRTVKAANKRRLNEVLRARDGFEVERRASARRDGQAPARVQAAASQAAARRDARTRASRRVVWPPRTSRRAR